MAEKRWGFRLMAMAALALALGTLAESARSHAQTVATGSLSGKLTDVQSVPVAGTTVVLENLSTGARISATTSKNGDYRFSAIAAGVYSLEADPPQFGHGHLDGIVIAAGHEARVRAAMRFDQAPPPAGRVVLSATAEQNRAAPRVLLAVAPRIPRPAAKEERASANPEIAVAEPAPGKIVIPAEAAKPFPARPMEIPGEPAREPASPSAASTPATAPPRQQPSTQTPTMTARLEAPPPAPETLAGLPAREVARPAAAAPAKVTSEPPSAVHPAPPQVAELASVAHLVPGEIAASLRVAVPAGVLHSLEVGTAVAAGVRAATALSLPRQQPVETALARPDPAAKAVTTTLTAGEVQALPGGRRWDEFTLDTPTAAAPGNGPQISLRGAAAGDADTTIDGASIRLAFGNGSNASDSPSRSSSGYGVSEPSDLGKAWSGGRGVAVAESAVRQVETIAGNVEAADARAAGGRNNVETRSGTNVLRGQAFFFDRQNVWGARNPYTTWEQETAAATTTTVPTFTAVPYTPPDHETKMGMGMGGKIRRNRMFWFAALDTTHRNDPGLAMVKWPDNFFAQPSNDRVQLLGAQLGTNNNNAMADYSKALETLDGLLGPGSRTTAQWSGFAKLDWQVAERHHVTLEGIGADWKAPGGGFTGASEHYGNHSFGSSQATEKRVTAREEAFLTPNLLAVTQASFGQSIRSAHPSTPSSFEKTLEGSYWNQLPQIVVDSRYGFTIGNPARFGQGSYPDERSLRMSETLDWVHGKILVKAGAEAGHNADVTGLLRNQTGTYYYSNVANFISDALVFGTYGMSNALDKFNQHNCDQTGNVWRDSAGVLRGLGYLPCYSYYSQTMGPGNWHVSTNDLAGYATAQWQPSSRAVFSLGMRWEREQLPPPIAALDNPALPLTEKVPDLGNGWGPRVSVAIGSDRRRSAWPVLRLGYGIYYGQVRNATLESVLTETGSTAGDMSFFMRPTDNLNAGGAPPFPYVLAGEPLNMVKPGAVEFAPNFRRPEVHQAVAGIETDLPGHVEVSASAVASLARRLPVSIDTNYTPLTNQQTITYAVVDTTGKGPIKADQITVPFYAAWPSATSSTGTVGRLNTSYQQIAEVFSRANSTYEAAVLRVNRASSRGVSLHINYTYAHATDWNPNESMVVSGSDVLDPADFSREYGTSNLDVRHSASVMLVLHAPWRLRDFAGNLANGWMLSGVGNYRSGLPYTMRTSGSLPKEFNLQTGAAIAALGPGMNGSGGDNRVYGLGSDGIDYNIGRNTFRYPQAWKADVRLGREFALGEMRELQFMAESFNLFNHRNVTQLETTGYYLESGSLSGALPTLNFLTGLKANTTAFGQPLGINSTNYYRERQFQFGLRLRF